MLLTDEQEMVRDTFARFLDENSSTTRVRAAIDASGFDADLWRGLGEMGAFAMRVPEEAGGLGLGLFDAAVLMEVVEHVEPDRLPALEHAVFAAAAPATVIVTTPNAEHNVRYPGLTGFRHRDHRFEWTRAGFAAWTRSVAERHGYTVVHKPVGDDDPEVGPPTQLAVFSR